MRNAILAILLCFLFGCASPRIMKNCNPVPARDSVFVCDEQ